MGIGDLFGKAAGKAAVVTFKTGSKMGRSVTDVAMKEPVKDLGELPPSALEAAKATGAGVCVDGGSSVAPGGKSKGGSLVTR